MYPLLIQLGTYWSVIIYVCTYCIVTDNTVRYGCLIFVVIKIFMEFLGFLSMIIYEVLYA